MIDFFRVLKNEFANATKSVQVAKSAQFAKPEQVARYYDVHTDDYMAVGGDVIQAMRPEDTNELLAYLLKTIALKDGMRVLDAGCGVAGPAMYFASHASVEIEGLTISPVQCELARKKIREAGLSARIKVHEGDYHYLCSYYAENSFDAVLFLESLGHAADPARVLKEAYAVLKPGGYIFIKDFFMRTMPSAAEQILATKIISNIDRNYCYNTLNFNDVISALRRVGFYVDFVQVPHFVPTKSYTDAFERRLNLSTFGPIRPVDWYEIKCIKCFSHTSGQNSVQTNPAG